ncbi:MAG: hypothetical protein IMW90_22490 [Thermogemmatispora sp.]|uniref:hypothetical protein n=1 Tax=Thermogemmatispora sp. TaxID=1968838 RepID=UPI0019E8BD20|nr:hypothetical protein [Thermogemmatispora sp.]MBE3568494.1 hypothetical protein [Thermogemmatispora sp.]
MTIEEQWPGLSSQLGARRLRLPTPPACLPLLERARQAGIQVGDLFVVSRPLVPLARGGYELSTGHLWCHYDARLEEAERSLLQCLLVLLAALKRRFPAPRTLEEEREQHQQLVKDAAALARDWQRPDLFVAADLDRLLAEAENRFDALVAVGELAGSLDPPVAHAASLALCQLREREGWSQATFEAALAGISDDEEQNAAVLTWDRTLLRARWMSPVRSGPEQPAPQADLFGPLTVPQSPAASTLLRQALEQVAHRGAVAVGCWSPQPLNTGEHAHADQLCFLQVSDRLGLERALAHISSWLLDLPERYLQVHWSCYGEARGGGGKSGTPPSVEEQQPGSDKPTLYRSGLTYHWGPGEGPASPAFPSLQGQGAAPLRRELWVLFAACPHRERLEAAWQLYLSSWQRQQRCSCASLAQGLQDLWSVLAPAAP